MLSPASIKPLLLYYVVQQIFFSLAVVTENYPQCSDFHCTTRLVNHPADELIQLIIKTRLNAYNIFHVQGSVSTCKLYFEDRRQKSVLFCSRVQQLITVLLLITRRALQHHVHITFPICSARRALEEEKNLLITTVFLGASSELLCFWDLLLTEAALCFSQNIFLVGQGHFKCRCMLKPVCSLSQLGTPCKFNKHTLYGNQVMKKKR